MTVRKPRGAPAQDADLTWFFCSMACDVGQKSIHGAIIDMGVSGVSSASPYGCSRTRSHRALDAAGDGRRMSAAYGAISETHQVMLCAAYGPQGKIPKEMRDAYRPFPGVVMLTETAERAFAAAVHERGQRKPSTLATAAGVTRHLAQLTPGTCFGIVSVASGDAHPLTMHAMGNAHVRELTRDQYEQIRAAGQQVAEVAGGGRGDLRPGDGGDAGETGREADRRDAHQRPSDRAAV